MTRKVFLLILGVFGFCVLGLTSCVNLGGMTMTEGKAASREFSIEDRSEEDRAKYLATHKTLIMTNFISDSAEQVVVNGPLTVELVNGSDITAYMRNDIFVRLEILLDNEGILTIQPPKGFAPMGKGPLVITIGIDAVPLIVINTSRPFVVEKKLTGTELSLVVTGASSGQLPLEINNLNLTVESSQPVTVVGQADELTLRAGRFAKLDLRRFEVANDIESDEVLGSLVKK